MSCCTTVEQGENGLIESCGKFNMVAQPGLHCLVPCRDRIAGVVSTRLMEVTTKIDSKTRDNVFIGVDLKVQYCVLPGSIEQAFYSLDDVEKQIRSYIKNAVRGQVPQYELDQIFLMRGEISTRVKEEIDAAMDEYGYDIVNVLIVDLDVGKEVTDAMNSIQTQQRTKNAIRDAAEASKISIVKAAEADSEAKKLSGEGLAEQRKAIVGGLQSSVEMFRVGVPGMSNDDIMSLLLLNQYFDMLKDVARSSSAVSLFISHTGGLDAVARQMEEGVIKSHKGSGGGAGYAGGGARAL